MTTHLKLYDKASSLRADGSRNFVHPADVSGRFDRVRKLVFVLLIGVMAVLPWWNIGGHPAVFLDMPHRCFYLFGGTFNAQDVWLMFFLLTGVGFGLIVTTALWGRLWCGYACPQTVFLEGLFRPIERLIEGPRNERIRRNQQQLSWDKAWRKVLKHALFMLLAFAIAHIILAYFVSLPGLYHMVLSRPAEHPEAFVWAASLTLLLYVDFFWFREQLCLIICPYGRLQSVLADHDTLIIGYDEARGEPRGKVGVTGAGACVDCNRCVVVCPTGIDIRNGLQIDCIGCARCIDACDEVMHKLGRPPGLVRYDSQNGLLGKVRQHLRPRVALYAVLGLLGVIALSIALSRSTAFEANVLRLRDAPPFVVENGRVRNAFEVHLVNKRNHSTLFELRAGRAHGLHYVIAMPRIALAPLGDQRVPVFVDFAATDVHDGASASLELLADGIVARTLHAPLLAPSITP